MSIFGFYFTSSLLKQMGWPRKLGLLRGEGFDTLIVDSSIVQMVDWAAAIGAGRPMSGLQMVAEMFRDRDWTGEAAPNVKMFVEEALKGWDASATQRDVAKPIRLAESIGKSVSKKDFMDNRLREMMEQRVLMALLWGLSNPGLFEKWYAAEAARQDSSLKFANRAGLDVESMVPLTQFFEESAQILDDYQRDIHPLPGIPPRLLRDAQELGWPVP